MAITSLYANQVAAYPSVNDQIWITGTSDLSPQINFKYIVDIFNPASQQVFRGRVFPEVGNFDFYFDAASIVRNMIDAAWFEKMVAGGSATGQFHAWELDKINGQAGVYFKVCLGEEYYSGNELVASYQQLCYDLQVWNYIPPLFGRRITDLYVQGERMTKRPLTARYVRGATDPLFIGFFSYQANSTADLKKKILGNPTPVTITNLAISITTDTLQQLNIAPNACNQIAGNFIDQDTEWYEVTVDNFGQRTTIHVDLICTPPDIQPVSVHFLNSYGTYDTALFELVNKKMMAITRRGFQRAEWELYRDNQQAPTANYYTGTENNPARAAFERKLNFETESNTNLKLSMDYPTDAEWEWLADLVTSPQIYISKQGATGPLIFYPVTIKADNYEFNQRRYAKLKTFEIEVELNQPRTSNRR